MCFGDTCLAPPSVAWAYVREIYQFFFNTVRRDACIWVDSTEHLCMWYGEQCPYSMSLCATDWRSIVDV
jgi:hypothetical protein